MRFFYGIVALLTLQVGHGASAATANCVPRAEMQTIASHFKQFASLANSDYCYDGSQTSNLIKSIEFMRKTPYTSSMPVSQDELFSGTFAKDWYSYFIGRINDFSVQASCPQGVGAFVYFTQNTMFVCPLLLTDSFSAIDRVSVMMHEARHIDGFPHIQCDQGPRAGMPGACDQRVSDKGSYTVTVETYAQLGAYATDLNPALKAYASASAVVYADEAFEEPARVDRQEEFLLMTTKREFYRLNADGSAQVSRLGDSPSLGHLVPRARFLILFPEDKTLPANYVFAHNEGAIAQAAGDLAIKYNAKTPQQRQDLVDLFIGAQWSTQVYHDHLTFACDPTSTATQDVSLNGQVAAGLIYPNGYNRASTSNTLVTQAGSVLEFGCDAENQAFVKASLMQLDQPYKRIYKMGQETLGLTPDGRLFQLDGNRSTALQTSVDGQIFEMVPTESFQFFDAANTGA